MTRDTLIDIDLHTLSFTDKVAIELLSAYLDSQTSLAMREIFKFPYPNLPSSSS